MNKFQQFLLDKNNKQLILDIIKLYHPDLSEVDIKHVKVTPKYDWICLNSNIVSIGIEFRHPTDIWGEGHKIKVFERIHNTSKFRAWRFYDDLSYKKTEIIAGEIVADSNCPDINELFVKYNVTKPTPKELYDYYYRD